MIVFGGTMNTFAKILVTVPLMAVSGSATTITFNGGNTDNTSYFTFNTLQDNEYCITKCRPNSNPDTETIVTLIIPGSVDGKQVSLGEGAFDWSSYTDFSNLKVELIFKAVDDVKVKMPQICSYMFQEIKAASKIAKISIDLSGIDTSNVTDMTGMFQNCSKLISLDLSNFNTSKVTNMANMFYLCSGLTSLNVSSFDTSNVLKANSLFNGCSSLTSLDISNFDTNAFANVGHMFNGCTSLTSLDLSNFTGSKIANYMDNMFNGCKSLTYLDISNIDANNTIKIGDMFANCSALSTLKISEKFSPPTDTVTGIDTMFLDCNANINIVGTKVNQFIVANTTVKSKINTGANKVYIYSMPSVWISDAFKEIAKKQLGNATFEATAETTTDLSKVFTAKSTDSLYIAQNETNQIFDIDGKDKTITGALVNKTIDDIGYYPAALRLTGSISLSGNNSEFNEQSFIVGNGIKDTTITLDNPNALPQTDTIVESKGTLVLAGTENYTLSKNITVKSGGKLNATKRVILPSGTILRFGA